MSAPDGEQAATLARTLLEEGLIACANITAPVRSVYRWEGKMCDEQEVLVVMKTAVARFEALEARILSLHSYSVPEVLRLDVAQGHQAYLQWVLLNTK